MKNETKHNLERYKWDKTKTDFIPGNSLFKDRTGKRKGKLVYLYPIRKGKEAFWVSQCDCGGISTISVKVIEKVNACKCGISRKKKDNPSWDGFEDISGNYLYGIKQGAIRRNFDYSLTNEYIWDLYQKQNRKCALSELDIHFGKNGEVQTASLDRIDSNFGYAINNVQWVHKDVNKMKNNLDEKYFKFLCESITNLTYK